MPAEMRSEDHARRRAARWSAVLVWVWLAYAVFTVEWLMFFLGAMTLATLHCVVWACLAAERLTKRRLSAARIIGVAVPTTLFFLLMAMFLGSGYLPIFAIYLMPFLIAEIFASLAIGRIPDGAVPAVEEAALP